MAHGLRHFQSVFVPILFLLGVFLVDRFVLAQVGDVTPPVITGVEVFEVTDTSVTVKWKTNESADSVINYGLNKNYGTARDPLPNKQEHEMLLDELDPSTTYHFRVVSSDVSGNQSLSGDYVITTKGVKDIKGIERVESTEERALVEKSLAPAEKIKDPEALSVIVERVQELAQGITDDLTIIGNPEVRPETTKATVIWRTDRASNSIVSFVSEAEYNPNSENPYTFSQGNAEEAVVRHEVEIIGLEPATTYHLQVVSRDQLGIAGRSEDIIFTTKAVLPEISGLEIIKIEEDAATFAWQTSVPASALIEYENLDTGVSNSKGNPSLTTDHELRISDLELGASYRVVVIAENVGGDRIKSEPIEFITVKDEAPPIISKVTNESTLFPGSEARIQTIVSWQTDEPSVCDFFYRQGLAPTVEEEMVARQDENFLERHVQVITEFTPSTVYQFWLSCVDRSGNSNKSENFVLFTPEKEKSIIDIILENFEGTFGWVKSIGK